MYTVIQIPAFSDWLRAIKDRPTQVRLMKRLRKAQLGNLGDVKQVGSGVWEMREFFTLFDLKRNGDITLALDGSYWMMGENGTILAGSWDSGDQCGVERNFFPATSGYVRAIRP